MNEKIKILYIDDEEINITLFKINLPDKYELLTGYSGLDGLKLLGDHPDIEIIISDMKMPYMTGLEFIKQAKEKHNNKSYFILTGFDISDEIKDAIETGLIIKYFNKPFNMNEIEEEIIKNI